MKPPVIRKAASEGNSVRGLGVLVLVSAMSVGGWSLMKSKPTPLPSGPYHTGLQRLAEGDFAGADLAMEVLQAELKRLRVPMRLPDASIVRCSPAK